MGDLGFLQSECLSPEAHGDGALKGAGPGYQCWDAGRAFWKTEAIKQGELGLGDHALSHLLVGLVLSTAQEHQRRPLGCDICGAARRDVPASDGGV